MINNRDPRDSQELTQRVHDLIAPVLHLVKNHLPSKKWFLWCRKMFLNFTFDPKICPNGGVELTTFKDRLSKGSAATVWKQWEYQFMGRGLTSSPYNSVQYFYWAETSAWGNRLEENNPMQWNVVKLNLPGCDSYSAALPTIMKWKIKSTGSQVMWLLLSMT